MSVVINGDTGVSKVQDGVVETADLAPGLKGKLLVFSVGTSTSITLVSPNTATKLTYNVLHANEFNSWDVNTSRFVVTTAGTYRLKVTSTCRLSNTGDVYQVYFFKNGVAYAPFEVGVADSNAQSTLTGTLIKYLVPGDYIEVYGRYVGGGSNRTANHYTDLCSVEGWLL
jgi:hypothetical protein